MSAKLLHPYKLALFYGLSLADLGMTWYLLAYGDQNVYEANPVAGWWLDGFGWAGLSAFKAGMVLLVSGLVLTISRYRQGAGGRVLAFACAALAGVVLYSCCLAWQVGILPGGRNQPQLESALRQTRTLERQIQNSREFFAASDRLSQDLIQGRRTLAGAVRELGRLPQNRDPRWLSSLQFFYPGRPLEECLAVTLMGHVKASLEDDATAAQHERRLRDDFEASYGRPAPLY
jgi:hypothetical protein